MFEKSETANKYRCKFHKHTKAEHPEFVSQTGPGTSNLLAHAKQYHEEAYSGLVKASNENRSMENEMDGLLKAMKV